MKNYICLFLFLFSTSLFSQKWKAQSVAWNKRNENETTLFRGLSAGVLFQGQTQYPSPYYGPKVTGGFNDGAIHLYINVYVKNILLGLQLADEFLFLEQLNDQGAIWKPRGFNQRFSSLTQSLWFSIGYPVWHNLYIKGSFGWRSGPKKALFYKSKTAADVAQGFDFEDSRYFYNSDRPLLQEFSETDFMLTANYLFPLWDQFYLAPEVGFAFKHAGWTWGVGLVYFFKSK